MTDSKEEATIEFYYEELETEQLIEAGYLNRLTLNFQGGTKQEKNIVDVYYNNENLIESYVVSDTEKNVLYCIVYQYTGTLIENITVYDNDGKLNKGSNICFLR